MSAVIRRWLLGALFLLAAAGLVMRIGIAGSGSVRLLLGVLLLLGADLAGAAVLDLELADTADLANADGQEEGRNPARLRRFRRLVWGTIALELIGFYLAAVYPGWGAVIVLLSQVGFNLFAEVTLEPTPVLEAVIVIPWNPRQRLPVLAADGLGLGLVGFWLAGAEWSSMALLLLVMAYLVAKYGEQIGRLSSNSKSASR